MRRIIQNEDGNLTNIMCPFCGEVISCHAASATVPRLTFDDPYVDHPFRSHSPPILLKATWKCPCGADVSVSGDSYRVPRKVSLRPPPEPLRPTPEVFPKKPTSLADMPIDQLLGQRLLLVGILPGGLEYEATCLETSPSLQRVLLQRPNRNATWSKRSDVVLIERLGPAAKATT